MRRPVSTCLLVISKVWCPRQVGRGHLRRCCDQCGGELACTQSPSAHAAGLAVFRGIARFHGFELLAEVVEWLLEVPGAA